MMGAVQFVLDGDIGEGLVEGAVGLVDLHAHRHADILLGELHDAVLALEEEGGLLGLTVTQVVAGDVLAAIETEESWEGICLDEPQESFCIGVGGMHPPGREGGCLGAETLAGGFVACGSGGEGGGGHLDGEIRDI